MHMIDSQRKACRPPRARFLRAQCRFEPSDADAGRPPRFL